MCILDDIVVGDCNFFLDGPRVGSPSWFASSGLIKIHVVTVSKIPIVARAWSRRPMIFGVSFFKYLYCGDEFLELYTVFVALAGCRCK